jgi:hypothetical protein
MQTIRRTRTAACLALALGSLAACGDDQVAGPDGAPPGATGTVVVQLAGTAAPRIAADAPDGPGNGNGNGNGQGGGGQAARFSLDSLEKVEVFVVRVDAKREDADSAAAADSATSDAEKDRGGWTTVAEPKARVDLLTLRDGRTTALGGATLPAGTYRSLRLIVDASQSRVTLKGGQAVEVKWPSAGRSGIKVLMGRDVTVGKDSTSALRLDFDVAESFVVRGASMRNGLLFKPVIRAATR